MRPTDAASNGRKSTDKVIAGDANSVTAVGFSNLLRHYTRLDKVIWFLCFVLSATLCIYMIAENVDDYKRYEVITKIRRFDEKVALFPSIMICNKNPFVTEEANRFLEKFAEQPSPENKTGDDNIVFINVPRAGLNAKSPVNDDNFRRSLGLDIKDMIIKCSFAHESCSLSDFVWHYDWDFGNCYQFNAGYNSTGDPVPIKKVHKGGRFSGLYLQLFIGRPQRRFLSEITNGIYLLINNQSFKLSMYEGIDAQPGTLSNIDIRKVFTHRMNKPYSDCQLLRNYNESILYSEVVKGNKEYRRKDCFELCKQMKCIEKCKCYDLQYPKLFNTKPCLNETEIKCSEESYAQLLAKDIGEACASQCPLECDSVNYELSMSTANYPTRVYAELLKKREQIRRHFDPNETITYEKIKETVVALDINYVELKYTMITETPSKTIIDLIAGIGGTIGLFLGMSLLGLVDVVFCLHKLFIKIRPKQ